MDKNTPVIVSYARTPFGKFMGGLARKLAPQLGGIAIQGALERAGIDSGAVDHVIMGNVIQAGVGQIPSRQAAVHAGLPMTVTSETLNKVCASGHRAITWAATLITAGRHDVVVAGGMESMTNAPHLMQGSRNGFKMGDVTLVDAMLHDGLNDPFDGKHMVIHNSAVAEEVGISRDEQDAWAAMSQQRATSDASRAAFAEEIVPVTIASRKGETVVDADEAPRAGTTAASLGKLPPVFTRDGSTTAGNAPGVNDGAAAVVVTSLGYAQEHDLEILAYVRQWDYIAGDSPYICRTPAQATEAVLAGTDMSIDDIDRVEINEAFAMVAINSSRMIEASEDKVNVLGGAVALGHPIGASGARIIGSLAMQLKRDNLSRGIAAICSGGGQGDAVLLTRE